MGFFGLSSALYSNYVASSLNMLFFYLTWVTLVLSQPPIRIELIGSIAVRIIFYWFPTLFFTTFEALMPESTNDWKIRRGEPVSGHDKFWIGLTGLTNHLIVTLLQGILEYMFTQLLPHRRPIFNIGTTLPMPWTILKHVLLVLTIRELITYFLHRYLLHSKHSSPRLTNYHSKHHNFSQSSNFALKAPYAHPIDFLVLQALPLYLPCYTLRLHLLTFFLILAITSLEATVTYSGYDVFWGVVGNVTRRVERHHAHGGEEGDFGIWGPWDWILGTVGGRRRNEQRRKKRKES